MLLAFAAAVAAADLGSRLVAAPWLAFFATAGGRSSPVRFRDAARFGAGWATAAAGASPPTDLKSRKGTCRWQCKNTRRQPSITSRKSHGWPAGARAAAAAAAAAAAGVRARARRGGGGNEKGGRRRITSAVEFARQPWTAPPLTNTSRRLVLLVLPSLPRVIVTCTCEASERVVSSEQHTHTSAQAHKHTRALAVNWRLR